MSTVLDNAWARYRRPMRDDTASPAHALFTRLRMVHRPGVARTVNDVRRQLTAADVPGFPKPTHGKGTPVGWYDWYDWVLVYRYWIGEADGLRRPYLLEIAELLRLGGDLDNVQLANRLGFSERQVARWKARLAG